MQAPSILRFFLRLEPRFWSPSPLSRKRSSQWLSRVRYCLFRNGICPNYRTSCPRVLEWRWVRRSQGYSADRRHWGKWIAGKLLVCCSSNLSATSDICPVQESSIRTLLVDLDHGYNLFKLIFLKPCSYFDKVIVIDRNRRKHWNYVL